MTKNLGIPCFVLTGFVLLSWSVAVGDDAGFGGGGHSPGGFTGSHVSGGFSSGVRVNSGSALSHSSGSFSGVAVNSASSGGGHTNGGWPGGHANNGRLAPQVTATSLVTRPRNFSGDGFAAHAGNDRTLSNVQRHSAGTNTFDHLHDFGHFRNSSLVIAPFGFPFPDWYSLYGWPDYGDYGNYDYGPGPDNYYDYGSAPVNDVTAYSPAMTYATLPATTPEAYSPAVTYASPPVTTPEETTSSTGESTGEAYAARALEAFHSGNYRDALRWAHHAAVEMPRDARIHELMSLSLFALKDYRGATMEAHFALALGPVIDWPTLYAYYGNVDTYTNQLRTLGTFVDDNPKAPEGHFLLAYHFLMTGFKGDAKKELKEVVTLVPADRLAAQLLKQL